MKYYEMIKFDQIFNLQLKTLGGLFSIHTLEIVSDEDPEQKRMCFDINFPVSTEAQCQQEKTQA